VLSNELSAYLCDPSAALRFIGFTAVITAEARRTAEIRREDKAAAKHSRRRTSGGEADAHHR
jgi:hypothetical protein